jgi:hypothetical protein
MVITREVLATSRRELMRQAAYSLADSGRYLDWQAIENVLCLRYGVLEARRMFFDQTLCQNVSRRCAAAIGGRSRANEA